MYRTANQRFRIQLLILGTSCTLAASGCNTMFTFNTPPVANAGADQTAVPGQKVVLDASGSTDADDDPLTFSWRQRSGPVVALTNANTIQASFAPTEDGMCEFALSVTDGRGGSDMSVVKVFVNSSILPSCPLADAGVDQVVREGATVRLQGGNSADPSGEPLSFEWLQLSGPQVSINGVFVAEPTFTAPQVSSNGVELMFELTVLSESGCSVADIVVISVTDRDYTDPCDATNCPDDGLFCNGAEACVNGVCVSVGNPCTDDQICDEASDSCEEELICIENSDCDDGLFCNGLELCVAGECTAGIGPCTDDEYCDEVDDVCIYPDCTSNGDCDNGLFCDGQEICIAGTCEEGEPPCLSTEFCDETSGSCIVTSNGPFTILSSEWREDAIDPVVDMDTFTFTGTAGDRVFIQANRTSGALNPRIDLYPPSGGAMEAYAGTSSLHNHSIAALFYHELAESGRYSIVVRDDGANHTGGYILSLLNLSANLISSMDPDGGSIALEEVKTGAINPVADQDGYIFNGTAGQRLVIQANRTSGSLNPQIHLYPPSGGPREALAGTSSLHNHSIAHLNGHELAESGEYIILVLDDGNNHTGDYMLSVNVIP